MNRTISTEIARTRAENSFDDFCINFDVWIKSIEDVEYEIEKVYMTRERNSKDYKGAKCGRLEYSWRTEVIDKQEICINEIPKLFMAVWREIITQEIKSIEKE